MARLHMPRAFMKRVIFRKIFIFTINELDRIADDQYFKNPDPRLNHLLNINMFFKPLIIR
jgi:hypothetical protein